MQVKEKPRDNNRLKFQPEYQNVEADYWKVKYLEAVIELQNANRGLDRLVRNKKRWADTAFACRRAFNKGFEEGHSIGRAEERNLLGLEVKSG